MADEEKTRSIGKASGEKIAEWAGATDPAAIKAVGELVTDWLQSGSTSTLEIPLRGYTEEEKKKIAEIKAAQLKNSL